MYQLTVYYSNGQKEACIINAETGQVVQQGPG
jgi:uncharacterized membrane protein YkoI